MTKIIKKEVSHLLGDTYFVSAIVSNNIKTVQNRIEKALLTMNDDDIRNKSIYRVVEVEEHSTYWNITGIRKDGKKNISKRDKVGKFYIDKNIIYHLSNGIIMVNIYISDCDTAIRTKDIQHLIKM